MFLFRLNPFIPSGFVAYLFSLTSITWTKFLIGTAGVLLPSVMISYSAEFVDNIDSDIIFGCYKNNPLTYDLICLFCNNLNSEGLKKV